MPSQPEIPFQFLSTQICTHCQLPVTCGPVYVINDLTILCGRCRMNAKDHYRNYAYEALASTFIYPCKNWRNHCPVSLRWNDSLDHERECNYQGCCTFCCVHPGAFCKSKREYPKDEIRLTLVPETFLEYLECVSCRGYLNSSPIFMQSNGQNLCHRCIYSNGNPPNCRRNVAYENFSQLFLFPCTNKNRGCKERLQFGRPIWTHESQCPYTPQVNRNNSHQEVRSSIRLKPEPLEHTTMHQNEHSRPSFRSNHNQPAMVHEQNDQPRPSVKPKEKGLVRTQTGHVWATITPTKALFAPPDKDLRDVDKQLLKSIAKKQSRQIKRADQIGHEMGRRTSESESVSTSESYSFKTSGASTPENLNNYRTPYIPHQDYRTDSRPNSRESGYQTGTNRYQDELGYPNGLRPNEAFRDNPGPGQYPVLMPHQLSDGLDSVRRSSKRQSSRANNMLISELRLRQDFIKRTHSIKGEKDVVNPYKQCNNLEDIKEVHRQLR